MNSQESIVSDCKHPLSCLRLSMLPRDRYVRTMIQVLLLIVGLSGCDVFRAYTPPEDCYYLNPQKNVCDVGRITIVEMENRSSYPQVSEDVTKALFQAIQKKQLFGLNLLRRDDPKWRSLQLNSNRTESLSQLLALRRTLKCNAVLTGTVTEYQPYPHMAMGLRLKLVDLQDGQLLWAFEQVWDSADKKTEQRIKSYFKSQLRSGFVPLQEQLIALSPLRFIKFTAYEVAETLQPENMSTTKCMASLNSTK